MNIHLLFLVCAHETSIVLALLSFMGTVGFWISPRIVFIDFHHLRGISESLLESFLLRIFWMIWFGSHMEDRISSSLSCPFQSWDNVVLSCDWLWIYLLAPLNLDNKLNNENDLLEDAFHLGGNFDINHCPEERSWANWNRYLVYSSWFLYLEF